MDMSLFFNSGLPNEIIVQIFDFVPRNQYRNLLLTCKSWFQLSTCPTLWKSLSSLIAKDFPYKSICPVYDFFLPVEKPFLTEQEKEIYGEEEGNETGHGHMSPFKRLSNHISFLIGTEKNIFYRRTDEEEENVVRIISQDPFFLKFSMTNKIMISLGSMKIVSPFFFHQKNFAIRMAEMGLFTFGKTNYLLEHVHNSLLDDKDFIRVCIENFPREMPIEHHPLSRASTRIRKDRELVILSFQRRTETPKKVEERGGFILNQENCPILRLMDRNIMSDKEFVRQFIIGFGENKIDLHPIRFASDALRRDLELNILSFECMAKNENGEHTSKPDEPPVLLINRRNMELFRYIHPTILDNEDFISRAIRGYSFITESTHPLNYASERLKKDRNMTILALKSRKGPITSVIHPDYKNDKEIALLAVSIFWKNVEWFSFELKDDKEFGLAAVSSHGEAIKYLSERISQDPDIIIAALRTYLDILDEERYHYLTDDKEMALKMVKSHTWVLSKLSQRLREDREVVLESVKKFGNSILDADPLLMNDYEIVINAVKSNGLVIKRLGYFAGVREVALEAVTSNGEAIRYVSRKFIEEREFVFAALHSNYNAVKYVPKHLKDEFRELEKKRKAEAAAVDNGVSTPRKKQRIN